MDLPAIPHPPTAGLLFSNSSLTAVVGKYNPRTEFLQQLSLSYDAMYICIQMHHKNQVSQVWKLDPSSLTAT